MPHGVTPLATNLYNTFRLIKIYMFSLDNGINALTPHPTIPIQVRVQVDLYLITNKSLLLPHPLHREVSASMGMLEQAGLLTSFRFQAPSRRGGSGIVPDADNGTHSCETVGDSHPVPFANRV